MAALSSRPTPSTARSHAPPRAPVDLRTSLARHTALAPPVALPCSPSSPAGRHRVAPSRRGWSTADPTLWVAVAAKTHMPTITHATTRGHMSRSDAAVGYGSCRRMAAGPAGACATRSPRKAHACLHVTPCGRHINCAPRRWLLRYTPVLVTGSNPSHPVPKLGPDARCFDSWLEANARTAALHLGRTSTTPVFPYTAVGIETRELRTVRSRRTHCSGTHVNALVLEKRSPRRRCAHSRG